MPTPRPTQQTPQALIYRLLANIRNQFVPDLDDKAWYRDHYHFIQYYVVLWPARFMNGKGFTITPERYSQIMLSVLNEIKRHGATDHVRYWPGYLMKCLQEHWKHHWEEYYEEAKSIRNTALSNLAHLGKLPTRPDPAVETLAAAHRLLKKPNRNQSKRKKPRGPIQPDLFT